MAFGAATIWECRGAGAELNGCSFDLNGSGTDYSQQDAKNTVGNNISTTDGAVSAGTTTTLSSATGTYTSAISGNTICITGGTRTASIDSTDVVTISGSTAITSATSAWSATLTGSSLIKLSGGTASLDAQWFRIVSVNDVNPTSNGSTGSPTLTSVSATTGIVVGMLCTGTNIAAGTYVVSFVAATSITLSQNPTGNFTGQALNFKCAVLDRAPTSSGTGLTSVHAWYGKATYASATTLTLDRGCPLIGTGLTVNIGGATNNPMILLLNMISANVGWIKNDATYQTAQGFYTTQGYASPATNIPYIRLSGYGSTRGDTGRATLQAITNSGLTVLKVTLGGWLFENLIIDGNNLTTVAGLAAAAGMVRNVKVMNCTSNPLTTTGSIGSLYVACEVTACSGSAIYGINAAGTGGSVIESYVHDNAWTGASAGIFTGTCPQILNNIIANNSGSGTEGIYIYGGNMYPATVMGNICYNNGNNGIYSGLNMSPIIRGNILSNNGAYGIKGNTGVGMRASSFFDGNVFYANTSGTRLYLDDTGTTNKSNGSGPYTNIYDVILSASPFVNPGVDYHFKQTAAGNACRASQPPKSWPGLSDNTSFKDMGPIGRAEQGFAG